MFKISYFWIGPNIPVLIAGAISRAIELKNTIEQYFEQRIQKKLPFKAADVPDVLRIPVVRFKRKLVSEYVGLTFGMAYSEFFQAIGDKANP